MSSDQLETRVGIFWLVNNQLIIDCTPLSAAERYGDCLNHAKSHIHYWTEQQRAGVVSRSCSASRAVNGDRERQRSKQIPGLDGETWDFLFTEPADLAFLLTAVTVDARRSEEHTSELQSLRHLVCRLLLEK